MGDARIRGRGAIETELDNPERGISRLFVAIPVPAATVRALVARQPAPGRDVRLVASDAMHVTLHFLGNGHAGPVRDALRAIEARAFTARAAAPGQFSLPGGRRILWIGIEPTEPLIELHRQVGHSLEPLGFAPERRRYVPHITLARLGPRAAPEIAAAFEHIETRDAVPDFVCDRFALYASETAQDGPRYRILEAFGLLGRA
jgi:2'-5' RNA ligase